MVLIVLTFCLIFFRWGGLNTQVNYSVFCFVFPVKCKNLLLYNMSVYPVQELRVFQNINNMWSIKEQNFLLQSRWGIVLSTLIIFNIYTEIIQETSLYCRLLSLSWNMSSTLLKFYKNCNLNISCMLNIEAL